MSPVLTNNPTLPTCAYKRCTATVGTAKISNAHHRAGEPLKFCADHTSARRRHTTIKTRGAGRTAGFETVARKKRESAIILRARAARLDREAAKIEACVAFLKAPPC